MPRYIQTVACSVCKSSMPYAINPDLATQPRAVCMPCQYRQAAQAALPLEGSLPAGRFPLGSVHWGRATLRYLTGAVARELLGRHVAGDFGDVGELDEPRCGEVDPNGAAAWPLIADRLKRNALALRTGQGDVRSVFRLPLGERASRGTIPFTVATCPAAGLTLLFSAELVGDGCV